MSAADLLALVGVLIGCLAFVRETRRHDPQHFRQGWVVYRREIFLNFSQAVSSTRAAPDATGQASSAATSRFDFLPPPPPDPGLLTLFWDQAWEPGFIPLGGHAYGVIGEPGKNAGTYPRVMRPRLQVDAQRGCVRGEGLLNRSILLLLVAFLVASSLGIRESSELVFPCGFAVIFFLGYVRQCYLYRKMVEAYCDCWLSRQHSPTEPT